MDITVNDIVEESNIKAAMEYLSTKRDSCGIDGMKLSDLPGYWEANGAKIVDSILDGTYAMGLIKQCEIVNYKGKHRIISLMNSANRLVYRAAYQVLSPYFDTLFSCHSYAYRENKGVTEAIKQATEYMENGYTWSVELDIHSFFDNINQDFLINKIQNHISDDKIPNLIITYLKCTVIDDHTTYKKDEGILQGGQLSPLFSNIYMNELDHYMDENDYHFCRFGDDINIYCKTYDDAIKILGDVREHIENAEMLPLNHKKTGVYKGTNRKYLGFRFEKKGSKIIAKREKKAYRTVYRDWYTTGIQRVDSSYHLVNEGILTRRCFNVLFENDEGKKYIPVETTDSIYVYSNVILSGNFFEFINNHRS